MGSSLVLVLQGFCVGELEEVKAVSTWDIIGLQSVVTTRNDTEQK